MSIKLNVSFSKKLGQPDYSSLGASCSVETEIDGTLAQGDLHAFQANAERLYSACAQAVETELQIRGCF